MDRQSNEEFSEFFIFFWQKMQVMHSDHFIRQEDICLGELHLHFI